MKERCENARSQRKLHGEEWDEAHLVGCLMRGAHQNEPGLDMSLDPTASLRQPNSRMNWSVFKRVGGQRIRAQRRPGQPHSQVCVLGHIPGIPAA